VSSISPYTPAQWAKDFLDAAVLPVTAENVRAVVSWIRAESGDPPNAARFNPLNTTERMPGSWNYNYNGGYPVQNYGDYQTGIRANAIVLRNGRYPQVVAALQRGNDAEAVINAVVVSPWGTRHIVLVPPIVSPLPAWPNTPGLPAKVNPMHNPAIVPLGGVAADCACPTGGAWTVTPDGHVYTFGGAPYLGAPAGNSYWGTTRQAAIIQAVNYGHTLIKKWGYRITATSGETYDYKPSTVK
jgi:hypothetical protein